MVCEICFHGALLKRDGVFVCENCGTKYTAKEARLLMEKINVNGNTEAVQKQLQLARSAVSSHDYEGAAECYKKLAETHRNWETVFYYAYCKTAACAVSDISDNCLILRDSLDEVYSLIDALPDKEQRDEAAETVFKDAVHMARRHYCRALDTFRKVDPSIKNSFITDLSSQLTASIGIITHCCKIIRAYFEGSRYEMLASYGYKKALECKSLQKYVHIHLEPSAEEMLELLKKYEPEFARKYKNKRKKRKDKKWLVIGLALFAVVCIAVLVLNFL